MNVSFHYSSRSENSFIKCLTLQKNLSYNLAADYGIVSVSWFFKYILSTLKVIKLEWETTGWLRISGVIWGWGALAQYPTFLCGRTEENRSGGSSVSGGWEFFYSPPRPDRLCTSSLLPSEYRGFFRRE